MSILAGHFDGTRQFAAANERITSVTTTLIHLKRHGKAMTNSSIRSTVFAASWHVPFAARELIFHSGPGHVILYRQKLLRGYARRYAQWQHLELESL